MGKEDPRMHMHPAIAKSTPNSLEANAILNGANIRPLSFGGLLTKLVEAEQVSWQPREDMVSGTCALLGITPDEFEMRLKDPDLITAYVQDNWVIAISNRLRDEAIQAKTEHLTNYFSDSIARRLGDPNAARLEHMIQEQSERVDWLEGIARGRNGVMEGLKAHKKLDNWDRQRLADLEASSFAIPLAQLLDYLRDDEFLSMEDPHLQKSVVNYFASELTGQDIYHRWDVAEAWYNQELDDVSKDEIDELHTIWLAEADMKTLAEAYVTAYGYTDAGSKEFNRAPHPVLDILLITDQEKADFAQAYPMANPPKPPRKRKK